MTALEAPCGDPVLRAKVAQPDCIFPTYVLVMFHQPTLGVVQPGRQGRKMLAAAAFAF
jgi:hypothetical protein